MHAPGFHASPREMGAAVDMHFDGLSYRKAAENVGEYFDHPVIRQISHSVIYLYGHLPILGCTT